MLTSVTRWCIIITKGHSVRPAGCCKGGKMEKYIFSKALFEKNNIQDLGLVDFEGFNHNGYVFPSLRISPKHCLKIEVK